MKNETLYILSGKVEIKYGNDATIRSHTQHPYKIAVLEPGDIMQIQAGCPYSINAQEDSILIEVGDYIHDRSVKIT